MQASAAIPAGKSCPQHVAAQAHPAARPREPRLRSDPALPAFALHPVDRLLDMVEFDGLPHGQAARRPAAGSSQLHPGLVRWANRAAGAYLAAREAVLGEQGGKAPSRRGLWPVGDVLP